MGTSEAHESHFARQLQSLRVNKGPYLFFFWDGRNKPCVESEPGLGVLCLHHVTVSRAAHGKPIHLQPCLFQELTLSSPTSTSPCQSLGIKTKQATKATIGAVPKCWNKSGVTPLLRMLDKEGRGCEKLCKLCDTTPGSLSLSQGLPNLNLSIWLQTGEISLYWDSLSTSGLQ